MQNDHIRLKQKEFNLAMSKFHAAVRYRLVYQLFSFGIVILQLALIYSLVKMPLSWTAHLIIFLLAYFVTDLLNGAIHMYMDHNDNYSSAFGPFIANFHLHHQTPKYKASNIMKVYYFESGMKFWLLPYLVLLTGLCFLNFMPYWLTALCIYVGVLSSVAEVSHYLCHNSQHPLVRILQKMGILLSRVHHEKHHQSDNQNYAFLNGMSDPILNIVADKLYVDGYKKQSDLHFKTYVSKK